MPQHYITWIFPGESETMHGSTSISTTGKKPTLDDLARARDEVAKGDYRIDSPDSVAILACIPLEGEGNDDRLEAFPGQTPRPRERCREYKARLAGKIFDAHLRALVEGYFGYDNDYSQPRERLHPIPTFFSLEEAKRIVQIDEYNGWSSTTGRGQAVVKYMGDTLVAGETIELAEEKLGWLCVPGFTPPPTVSATDKASDLDATRLEIVNQVHDMIDHLNKQGVPPNLLSLRSLLSKVEAL